MASQLGVTTIVKAIEYLEVQHGSVTGISLSSLLPEHRKLFNHSYSYLGFVGGLYYTIEGIRLILLFLGLLIYDIILSFP